VIPTRGAWLEYEIGSKDLLFAKIDRSKKIYLSTMIKALGFSTRDQILNLFGDNPLLINTLDKDLTVNAEEAMKEVYAKIRQGETATSEGARSFFVSRLLTRNAMISRKSDVSKSIRNLTLSPA
jgi:DNA-directed RNA polymerase subunit beta